MQIEKTGQRAAKWRLPCFMLQRKDPAPRRRSGSLQELYKEEEESKLSRDLLEALEKQRNDLEQIAADAVIGNLKDGSVLILVDSNDTFGILHINDWTKQCTRAEIEKIIADEFRQAYSPVLRVSEVIENEQFLARDMIVDMEGPDVGKYKMQGIPIKMMATPGEVRTSAPVCGQDNNDILKELGRTEEEIAALKEHGVI